MSFIFNGVKVDRISLNGVPVKSVKLNNTPPVKLKEQLCFTANTAGSKIKLTGAYGWSGSYSINTDAWISYTPGTWITLTNVGDQIYFKGTYASSPDGTSNIQFYMEGSFAGSGNIMSLCSGDNFETVKEIPYQYCFYKLFSQCEALTSAPELPATKLKKFCYGWMFLDCDGLTEPPVLPATELAEQCYGLMFEMCKNLTKSPELPATIMAPQCYWGMFSGCENLTIPAQLPAITLATECYRNMYNNCYKLSINNSGATAWRIPTTGTIETVPDNALTNMLQDTIGEVKDTPEVNKTYYYGTV